MPGKKIVAMLLAGGQGSRLGELTKGMAKPAVPFGGKYRIIDFPLSNCVNSDIDTVGVLTQYEPLALNAYLGNGQAWDLDRNDGGVFVLPPYASTGNSMNWYNGTADAIYRNLSFIDQYAPKYVLILSGDHIYRMNYAKMLEEHIAHRADATIAVLNVPIEEASRFGIMNTDPSGRIIEFEEKPRKPKSTKASMGIYIFNTDVLKKYLIEDAARDTEHDFGKNIIPAMIAGRLNVFAWEFSGYWRDVGTIASLWEANMDLLGVEPRFRISSDGERIYSRSPIMPPHYVGRDAEISDSLIAEGCVVHGTVRHSVLFTGVRVESGAVIEDSIVMPNSIIGENAIIKKAIIGENATVGSAALVGCERLESDGQYDTSLTGDITLISNSMLVSGGERVPKGKVISVIEQKGSISF